MSKPSTTRKASKSDSEVDSKPSTIRNASKSDSEDMSKASTTRQATKTVSDHNCKAGTAGHATITKSNSDDKTLHEIWTITAAFRAIDDFDVEKLLEALYMGAAVSDTRPSSSDSGAFDSRSMSLIEYAVHENFSRGVELMLKVRSSSSFVNLTRIGPVLSQRSLTCVHFL